MADDATDPDAGNDRPDGANDGLDAETEATRLRSIEQYLEHLRESNPYYA